MRFSSAIRLMVFCRGRLPPSLEPFSSRQRHIGRQWRGPCRIGCRGRCRRAATSSLSNYAIDGLFRSDRIDVSVSTQEAAAQASRILANGIRTGDVPPADRTYLAQLVSAKTGISQADAQKRVDEVIAGTKEAETKAREAADAARKATATFAIFTALSLLIGAFVAMAAAAFGGNLRDEY
jgi:hypothetical protein